MSRCGAGRVVRGAVLTYREDPARVGARRAVRFHRRRRDSVRRRAALSRTLEDTLFALALLGDDRPVRATYVAGQPVWRRSV